MTVTSRLPGTKPTYTTKYNKVDLIDADHVNQLQQDMVDFVDMIGVNVQGTQADLATRLSRSMAANGSIRSGTSFPSDPVEGQLFYRTDEDTIYVYDGSAWDNMLYVADAAVSQAKLKTSQGTASVSSGMAANGMDIKIAYDMGSLHTSFATRVYIHQTGSESNGSFATVPGGDYSFFPQCKVELEGAYYSKGWIQSRYVTSSGKDHWIFILRDKDTKKISASWEAPDHPSYGQGGQNEEDMPHPFGLIKETEEIILIDNEILTMVKDRITSKQSLLEIIHRDFEIDDESEAIFVDREIIEIDERGDKKGKILGEFKTPDWAKFSIKEEKFYLKKRIVKTLPANIKYKKLKIKK